MGREDKRVVMVGLDAAGKTTILYKWKLGEVITTIPTIGFNVETIEQAGQRVTVWDAGLRSKARPLVKHYLVKPLDGLIFVVDANDTERLEEARDFLHYCLDAAFAEVEAPLRLLIFANKVDLPRASSPAEVLSAMQLEGYRGVQAAAFGCCATSGDGLSEGWDYLLGRASAAPAAAATVASRGGRSEERPVAPKEAAEASAGSEPRRAPRDDDAFLAAFELGFASAGGLPRFGVEEFARLAFLDRMRLGSGASARATFEVARRLGYVEHATRAWFWIALVYRLPLQGSASTSAELLEASSGVLPKETAAQEELISRAYSAAALSDPAAALVPVPPDCPARADVGAESDDSFLRRVEAKQVEAQELASCAGVARLAFVLLRSCAARREAIKRMDAALRSLEAGWTPPGAAEGETVTRAFHETRQYVTLHLVHAAIATRPDLTEFADLSAACPEVCEDACILQYYSEATLARGVAEFVPPDRQPLPSVLQVPQLTWHDELDDAQFLSAIASRSLDSLGTPSLTRCAYLYLRQGRRQGMDRLLSEVAAFQGRPGAGRFAHETLAYFCMHMVHFYASSLGWTLEQPFSAFAGTCTQALDPFLYKRHYSEALLFSEPAKTSLVVPDLCPLPTMLPRAVAGGGGRGVRVLAA